MKWKVAAVMMLLCASMVAQEKRQDRRVHVERTVVGGPHGDRIFIRKTMHGGKWWKNAELVQKVGVNEGQIQQMEQIFQDHRMKLVDIHAALEREELRLEPLIESDNPDENAVIAQIDKVAGARAELEKANARMLLAIRNVMSIDQWRRLKAEQPEVVGPQIRRFHLPAAPPAPPAPPEPPKM